MYAASLESIDFVEKLVREEKISPADFARCGHLEVACKAKHFDDFAAPPTKPRAILIIKQRIIPKDQCNRNRLVHLSRWIG